MQNAKPLGQQGWYWLLINAANNWAGASGRPDGQKTDKLPLNERVLWAMDNEEILLAYATSPKVNQGWMDADKPWQFLSTCMEIKKARDWESMGHDLYTYPSNLVVYIDGSTNGSQHLAALTKDDITAPLVNLVPLDDPGDLYAYVASNVWEEIDKQVAELAPSVIRDTKEAISIVRELKADISAAPQKSELRKEAVETFKIYKEENKELLKKAAVVFWSEITDLKERRKLCKRGTMTLPLK